MATHYHKEDILTDGLQDDCERCAQHAAHPVDSLDDKMLMILYERVRDNEVARTDNEAIAMRNLREVLRAALRLREIATPRA
jgi:hypothetical protein